MLSDYLEPLIFWYVTALVITLVTLALTKMFSRKAAREQLLINEIQSLKDPAVVYTLVHGTWARNAVWTRPGSILRSQLLELSDACVIRTFNWSGSNTDRARKRASTDLRAFLEEGMQDYPNARQFLICHSHGGNVALNAAFSPVNELLDGIVCLATPVIVQRAKHHDRVTSFFLRWWAVPPAFLLAAPFEKALNIPDGTLALLFVGAAILLMIWLRRMNWSDRVFGCQPAIEPSKVLFVRHPGDEASLSIGASNIAALVLEKFVSAPLKGIGEAMAALDRFKPMVLEYKLTALVRCILAGAVITVIGEATLSDQSKWLFHHLILMTLLWSVICWSIIATGFHTLILWFVAFALCAIYLLPMLVVTSLITAVALGPELALAVAASYVTVEVCPHGNWEVANVADDDISNDEDMLQHSRVYTSLASLRVMSDWIEQRIT